MNKKTLSSKKIFAIYGIIVFIFLFVFLSIINPLTVYDTDDWLYIGQFRKPIPMIGHWNPIKVFPETFMPVVSYLGVHYIMPLTHNYCLSLTLAHALFGSTLLTLYFSEFSLLFYRKKICSLSLSIIYGILFIILHFIAYIHSGNSNIFLIWSEDLTCFYNYTLSSVLCASLVMHSMSYGGMKSLYKKSTLPHKAILAIWLYFAIFSNLFSSVILAAYVGTDLLFNLIESIRNRHFNLIKYCSCNIINLLIIIIWFLSNFLETTGGRADDIGKSTLENVPLTISLSLVNILAINVFITALGLVVCILWIKKHDFFRRTVFNFIFYLFLSISYLIILSATVEPNYIYRAEVAIDILFYLFLALIAALNGLIYISKKYARLLIILSGTCILLFIQPGKVFFSYNNSNISYKKCEALMEDIIAQFKDAEQSGKNEVALIVPKYDVMYNWPLADFAGDNIAIALHNHGITQSLISVNEIVPSEEKNSQLGINEYELEENLKKIYSVVLVK
ncbi:hypothetical protein [Butyrivibrio sp. WCD2001]|uniref:hypothetical protein n=1 Tax=Butyrivibrio sp. WCD2001 TaxID=1280681 RepID=UPI0004133923|nr:hypothetical protein [Butyrivibrio sp. WCD2001]